MQSVSVRQSLLEALEHCLGPTPGIAVVHSSLALLGAPQPITKWDALYAVKALAARGWTLALPAFTFSFCRGKPYAYRTSPSETGQLADWCLAELPEAARSRHPIYSFAVVCPRRDELLACWSETCFSDDSPFGLFERANARLVMLGCPWSVCTQFHRYEEQAAVPYRYYKTFEGTADLGDGSDAHPARARMFVRDLDIDAINDFAPAVARLRERGQIAGVALWRGRVEAVSTGDLAEVARDMLARDPLCFVGDPARVVAAVRRRAKRAAEAPFTVAVLSSSNAEILRQQLSDRLQALMPERRADILIVPYGQMTQAVIDPASALNAANCDLAIFADRLEDLLQETLLEAVKAETIEAKVRDYAALVRRYHGVHRGWTVVHGFARLSPSPDGAFAGTGTAIFDRMNDLLRAELGTLDQLVFLDVKGEAALVPDAATDSRLWFLGRFPFSQAFSRHLANRWSGLALATLGKTARLIVLDLDNTLWGGVLGEDGLVGLRIGGDYPGNAYRALQAALKRLSDRGIALAVASKNDEDLALKAMDTLPDMLIRSDALVSYRINWQPKWLNIEEIAAELGLGLDNVLFVDDNPVEREAVWRNMPTIKILDLPEDPARFAEALLSSPWIEAVKLTAEDRQRVESYKARRQIERERASAASLDAFLSSLGMRLYLEPLNEGNAARAAKLCAKTNQFNATTRRRSAEDLRRLAAAGHDVVVVGLADKHSARENIGVMILSPHDSKPRWGYIDTFLLSCRILGRGVEQALPIWALQRAAARGWSAVEAEITETERNTPVRRVYAETGFAPGDRPGLWRRATDSVERLPDWLEVHDRMPDLAMSAS